MYLIQLQCIWMLFYSCTRTIVITTQLWNVHILLKNGHEREPKRHQSEDRKEFGNNIISNTLRTVSECSKMHYILMPCKLSPEDKMKFPTSRKWILASYQQQSWTWRVTFLHERNIYNLARIKEEGVELFLILTMNMTIVYFQ